MNESSRLVRDLSIGFLYRCGKDSSLIDRTFGRKQEKKADVDHEEHEGREENKTDFKGLLRALRILRGGRFELRRILREMQFEIIDKGQLCPKA